MTTTTRHIIKHVRGGTWTVIHPMHGPIVHGYINRNEALRVAATLDAAQIDYTASDAHQRIIQAVFKA